jgi:dTMP kinase
VNGKFIVFEGPEGCGKTTQIARLKAYLAARDIDAVYTKEPGFIPEVRSLLLDPAQNLEPETELLLFNADRAEHIAKFIWPNLAQERWVICDRYTASTCAYQIHGRGLWGGAVVTNYATGGLEPDLWIWLDIDPKEGLKRIAKERSLDRMEQNPPEFFDRVAKGYKAFFASRERSLCWVDAAQSADDVQWIISRALGDLA